MVERQEEVLKNVEEARKMYTKCLDDLSEVETLRCRRCRKLPLSPIMQCTEPNCRSEEKLYCKECCEKCLVCHSQLQQVDAHMKHKIENLRF